MSKTQQTGLRVFVFALIIVDSINMKITEHPTKLILSVVYVHNVSGIANSIGGKIDINVLLFYWWVTTCHNKLCGEGMIVRGDKVV